MKAKAGIFSVRGDTILHNGEPVGRFNPQAMPSVLAEARLDILEVNPDEDIEDGIDDFTNKIEKALEDCGEAGLMTLKEVMDAIGGIK